MSSARSLLRRRSLLLTLGAAWFAAFALSPGAADAGDRGDALIGTWHPDAREVVLQVAKSNGAYVGTITKAPSAAVVGVVLLRDFTFDEPTSTWKGRVYAPKRDALVPGVIRMPKAGEFVLTAGTELMSHEAVWVRD